MPASPRAGFTFVEVLIALVICVTLVGVVCSALVHTLRTERATVVLREAPLVLQTLACRTYLGRESAEAIAETLPPGWLADSEPVTLDEEDEVEIAWQAWRLAPSNDPGFAYSLGLRAGLGPWSPED